MNIYNGFKTMIFSDGESLQKKTIAVKGIVFYVKYFARGDRLSFVAVLLQERHCCQFFLSVLSDIDLLPRNARLSKADNVWLAWFYQFRVHDGYWLQDPLVAFGKRSDSCYLYDVAVSHYSQGQRRSGSGLCASLYAPACHQL